MLKYVAENDDVESTAGLCKAIVEKRRVYREPFLPGYSSTLGIRLYANHGVILSLVDFQGVAASTATHVEDANIVRHPRADDSRNLLGGRRIGMGIPQRIRISPQNACCIRIRACIRIHGVVPLILGNIITAIITAMVEVVKVKSDLLIFTSTVPS